VTVLLLLVAGAAGALLRYEADRAGRRRWSTDWPLGILLVNVSGSLALGLLVGLAGHRGVPSDVVTVVGTGLLGAYTTFSTVAVDTVTLAGAGRRRGAVGNLALSTALGLGTAGLGILAGAAL
jgi:fluoride exporter